jgi:hypothetical protein
MDTNKRRTPEEEIARLTARVEDLDRDVQKLRGDFEEHIVLEDEKYSELQGSLRVIEAKMDQLLVDIKEPIEAYKKAKYGVGGLKWILEVAKWFLPLITGLVVGYGSLKPDLKPVVDPATHVQQEK